MIILAFLLSILKGCQFRPASIENLSGGGGAMHPVLPSVFIISYATDYATVWVKMKDL